MLRSVRIAFTSLVLVNAGLLGACPEDGKRPIGGSCDDAADCASGLCLGGQCVSPDADTDGDLLINSLEVAVGSDPLLPDTDGDGRLDATELSDTFAIIDTDGDARPDILESATADADGDCITDQFDAEDSVPDIDLSPMRKAVCKQAGICADQFDNLLVVCPDGLTARCDYSNVTGYADPEGTCDGVDENCDGVADDGFPDEDADLIADCVDPDFVSGIDRLEVSAAPTAATAGDTFSITLTALNRNGDIVTDYAGTIAFASSDPGATLPSSYTFVPGDEGRHTFDLLSLTGAGSQTITVTDEGGQTLATITLDIAHGPASALEIEVLTSPVVAGVPVEVQVSVVDAFGNVVTDFTGTVSLSSSDEDAVLPDAYTFTASDMGVHVFQVTLVNTGEHSISASEEGGDVEGTTPLAVGAGADVSFQLSGVPDPATAGAAFDVTLTVVDSLGNTVTDYSANVSLTSNDGAAELPGALTLTAESNGTGTFTGVVLKTAGATTLTATAGAATGSATTQVVAAEAAALNVAPSQVSVPAGVSTGALITAVDAYGNTASSYRGTVGFSSSDPEADVPPDHTFVAQDNGQFAANGFILRTVGSQSMIATDRANASITGSGSVTVQQGSGMIFVITVASTPLSAGSPTSVTLAVEDGFGNPVPGYVGTVTFSSTDDSATLPAQYTFTSADAGSHTFPGVVLRRAGTITLTATDAANAITVSTLVTVNPGSATTLNVSQLADPVRAGVPTPVTVRIEDDFGNAVIGYAGTVAVSTQQDVSIGYDPTPPLTFPTNGAAQVELSVTFETAVATTLTFEDAGLAKSVTRSTTVVGGAAHSVSISRDATPLTAGVPFDFVVAVRDAFGNPATDYTGTVTFVGSEGLSSSLPPYAFTGADAGQHTFSATFEGAGAGSITVSDASLPGTSSAQLDLVVAPGGLASFVVTPSNPTPTAGEGVTALVTPADAYGNAVDGFAGTVTVTNGDAAGSGSGPLVMDGPTTTGVLVFETAGEQTITVTSQGEPVLTGTGTVEVQPAAPEYVDFITQPGDAEAGLAIPAFQVGLYDAFDNLATNAATTTLQLAIARNANQGHLSGTTSAATVGGVATFDAAQIDRAGVGYTLAVGGAELASGESGRFDVQWQAPEIVGTPEIVRERACAEIDYTVAHPTGMPVDVTVEYRVGSGPYMPATQAGSSDRRDAGVNGVGTSAAGEDRTFVWNFYRDVGPVNATVTARLTASVGGVSSVAVATASATFSLAWTMTRNDVATTAPRGDSHGLGVGDLDGNGFLDLVLGTTTSNAVQILFQNADGDYVGAEPLVDVSNLDLQFPVVGEFEGLSGSAPDILGWDRVSGYLVLLYTTVNGFADVSFGVDFPTGCPDGVEDAVSDIAVADINRDGVLDALTACAGSGTFNTLYNDDGQLFLAQSAIDVDVPSAIATADIERDGYIDAVVGSDTGLHVIRNAFGGMIQLQFLSGDPIVDVALADLDGDGLLEAIAAHGGDAITVYRGRFRRGLEGNILEYFDGTVATFDVSNKGDVVSVGDLDHDGDTDIALGSRSEDTVVVLLNNGASTFNSLDFTEYDTFGTGGVGGGGAMGLHIADHDKNGRNDIAVARADTTSTSHATLLYGKHPQRCGLTLDAPGVIPIPTSSSVAIARDMNADGKLDVVRLGQSYEGGFQGFGVAWGLGDGRFDEIFVENYGQAPCAAREAAVGDLTGDGLLDVAVLNQCDGGGQVAVFAQLTDPSLTFERIETLTMASSGIAIGDLDNDGLDDLVYGGFDEIRLVYQEGNGDLVTDTPIGLGDLPSAQFHGIALDDLNKDGHLDIAFLRQEPYAQAQFCAVLSQADPRNYPGTVDAAQCHDAGYPSSDLRLLDIDGNGTTEAAWIEQSDPYYYDYGPGVLRVRGDDVPDSGDFDVLDGYTLCTGARQLEFQDMDGDALLDVITHCSSPDGVAVFTQTAGTFDVDDTFGFGDQLWGTTSLAAGDFTGDFLADIATTNALVRQGPAGQFDVPELIDVVETGALDFMEVADFDRDGRLDILIGDMFGTLLHMNLQQADGTFETNAYTAPTNIRAMTYGDFNGDDKLDFAVASGSSTNNDALTFFIQGFTPGTFGPYGMRDTDVVAPTGFMTGSDVTRDGRLDLVVTVANGSVYNVVLYENQGGVNNFGVVIGSAPSSTSALAVGEFFPGNTTQEILVAGNCPELGSCVALLRRSVCGGGAVPAFPCLVTSGTTLVPDGVAGMAVGDMDNDGLDDLVTLSNAWPFNTLAVYHQSPAGTIGAPTLVIEDLAYATRPRLADIDQDGLLDIVTTLDFDRYGAVQIFYDDVLAGGVPPRTLATPVTTDISAVSVGDIDGDGAPDVIVTDRASGSVNILRQH